MENTTKTKKQILIVFTGEMELGGIERSLIGLLDSIDYELYEVDLFLYGHHGPLFSLINPKVNILPEVRELAYLRNSLKEKILHGCFYSAALRIKNEIFSLMKKQSYVQNWVNVVHKCAPKLEKKYDIAIGFFLPFDYIIEKVEANVKIGWVHTDYSNELADENMLEYYYSKMDKICAVSEECKKTFLDIFPQFSKKTSVFENILSKNFIENQSKQKIEDIFQKEENVKIIVSVGRFCRAKNFDNIPEICKIILARNCNIRWYLIGYGKDESLIKEKIQEYGMQESVIILGKRENPYPYIKMCDLYVQPSRYEGKCVAVREAQILGKPVVITRYATADSQIEDGVDGIIVPMDNQGCAEGIIELLKDDTRLEVLRNNCKYRDYSNSNEISKLYDMI